MKELSKSKNQNTEQLKKLRDALEENIREASICLDTAYSLISEIDKTIESMDNKE